MGSLEAKTPCARVPCLLNQRNFRRRVALATTRGLLILPLSCCRRRRHRHPFQLFQKGKKFIQGTLR